MEQDKETDFTLGADYERLLDPEGHWSLGLFGEAIFADQMEWLTGVMGTFSPYHRVVFAVGVGAEFHESHGQRETDFLTRVGVAYIFHRGQWSLNPGVQLDFVRDETSLVWGLYIGRGF